MGAPSTWPAELTQYVSELPQGIDSYPDCTCKGSVWTSHAEALGDPAALAAVAPDPVAKLLLQPPVDGAWIPETYFNALLLLMRARRFPSDEAFLRGTYELNRKLLSGRLYRILFAVTSPEWVVNGAVGRWSTFHKGVGLDAQPQGKNQVRLTMTYPRGLVANLSARAICTAFEAAIELAGGKQGHVSLEGHGLESAAIDACWA